MSSLEKKKTIIKAVGMNMERGAKSAPYIDVIVRGAL